VDGGEERPVLEQLPAQQRLWTALERGVYFAYPGEPHHPVIGFQDFATGRVTPVATLEKDLALGYGNLAVSPDGQYVLFPLVDQQGSDIMLLEHFR
jgi:hypothetical protein